MNNIYCWLAIVLSSILVGAIHHGAGYNTDLKTHNRYYKFMEYWRVFMNYLIAGVLIYYFISVRFPKLKELGDVSAGDLVLGLTFLFCTFGWTPYFLKNVTEGATGLFERLSKK